MTDSHRGPPQRIAAFDAIRGVAVLLVMAFHFNVPGMHSAGRLGVTLFLALSGYLITSHLAIAYREGGRYAIPGFYLRRAFRIGPAAIAMVAVVVAISVVAGNFAQVGPVGAASVLLLTNIPLGKDLLWLSHTWSLSLEAQFYLVAPILVAAGVAATRRAQLVVAAASVGLVVLYPAASPLALGCLLALKGQSLRLATWAPLIVLAGCLFLLLSAFMDNQSSYYHLLPELIASVGAVLVVAAATRSPRFAPRYLVAVGTVSYSLYLWHLPVAAATFPAMYAAGFPWWIGLLTSTAVAALISAISYRFIERPLMSQSAAMATLRAANSRSRRILDLVWAPRERQYAIAVPRVQD